MLHSPLMRPPAWMTSSTGRLMIQEYLSSIQRLTIRNGRGRVGVDNGTALILKPRRQYFEYTAGSRGSFLTSPKVKHVRVKNVAAGKRL